MQDTKSLMALLDAGYGCSIRDQTTVHPTSVAGLVFLYSCLVSESVYNFLVCAQLSCLYQAFVFGCSCACVCSFLLCVQLLRVCIALLIAGLLHPSLSLLSISLSLTLALPVTPHRCTAPTLHSSCVCPRILPWNQLASIQPSPSTSPSSYNSRVFSLPPRLITREYSAFSLVFKDLRIIYQALNKAILRLLESYFEMPKVLFFLLLLLLLFGG